MDLSIIIVSWNCCDKLKNNLTKLMASEALSFEVFVVDNNSNDGAAEMVQRDFPQVHLIANKENLGFAKANNQALKLTQGDFVLLLNPDMLVDGNSLSQALTWLRANPQAWVTGFKLLDESGKLIKHVRRFPQLADQLSIVLKFPHLIPSILNKYIVSNFDYEQASRVDSVRGSFFFIRREALEKIGLLDERFFIWLEEVDYCKRVHQAGGEVWYSPATAAVDLVGQSFKLLSVGQTQKYFRDSQLKYFAKWHPVWQFWILKIAWMISSIQVFLFAWLKGKKKVN